MTAAAAAAAGGPADLNPPLTTFLAIHRAGSISAASAQLHLTQPAVTRRLQALERRLGAPLFDRTPGGLRLSSAGEALLPHAERSVAAERDGWQAVAEHVAGAVGSVAIGVVGSLAGPWLSRIIHEVSAVHPDVELVLSTATTRQIVEQVRRGDLAIGVSYARTSDPQVDVDELFDERLVVVAAPDHPLAGEQVTLDDLRGERWLMFPELPQQPESSGTVALRLLERHHVEAERIRPIDSLSAQRALARAGYGLAFVPESAVADDVAAGELAVIDVVDARVDAPVTVITRRGAYRSAAAVLVLERLRAVASSPS